jgi:hypothetical protein
VDHARHQGTGRAVLALALDGFVSEACGGASSSATKAREALLLRQQEQHGIACIHIVDVEVVRSKLLHGIDPPWNTEGKP